MAVFGMVLNIDQINIDEEEPTRLKVVVNYVMINPVTKDEYHDQITVRPSIAMLSGMDWREGLKSALATKAANEYGEDLTKMLFLDLTTL